MSALFTAASAHSARSVSADAVVPEQLVHYVTAVSSLKASLCGSHVLYSYNDSAVFVIFDSAWFQRDAGDATTCQRDTGDTGNIDKDIEQQVADALSLVSPTAWKNLTIIAPVQAKYENIVCSSVHTDMHWVLPLPMHIENVPSKVRNMIRHGERLCHIEAETWTAEHGRLVSQIIASKQLASGTKDIYKQVDRYAQLATKSGTGVTLLCARTLHDTALQAFIIGDMSALSTAFYMFAFRAPTAPAGTADALLFALATLATTAGHRRLSLGLGIHEGVTFFKKKWGAVPFMPHVETVFTQQEKPSLWSRIFAKGL